MQSVIKPLAPKGKHWTKGPRPAAAVSMGYPAEYWFYSERGINVISAVEVANDGSGIERGPEYHISISKNGGRCTGNEAKWVLRQFNLDGSEEDNHVPNGFVRNFWRPVNENLIGLECSCKVREPAMVEDKGDFVWRGITK